MSTTQRYRFERKRFSYRDEKNTNEALEVFVKRLNLPSTVSDSLNAELLNYITDMHLRISWYSQKLVRERFLSGLYITLTVAMLVAIPLLVMFLSGGTEPFTQSSYAAIAAIISGLLGIHKGFSSWLEQRRVIANFWEAKADLKEALYELEDKHQKFSPEEWDESASEALLKDLTLGSKFANRIERKERDQFFKNYKTPKFDLVSTLSSLGKKGQDLTDLFLDPAAEEQLLSNQAANELAAELVEAQAEVIQFEFEVTELQKLVDQRSADLETASEDELSAVKAGLRELQIKLERAKANLISAKARVLALQNALGIDV